MASAAAAAAASPQIKYDPKLRLPSEQMRNQIRDLFSQYSAKVFTQEPSERDLGNRDWCAVKLLEISELQLERAESWERALQTSHIAHFLLCKAKRPDSWPTWGEAKEGFNTLGPTSNEKDNYRCTAVLQLEEALELGGIIESGREVDIVLAIEQLAILAGLQDEVISLTALEALCSLLAIDLGPRRVSDRLSAAFNGIIGIMKRDKSHLPPDKAHKCIEVCALFIDKLTLMHDRGQALAQDYHDKYELWNLIEYFQGLNTKGNPDIAAWSAFALERLKKVEAPISLVRILSETEVLLKNAAITAASIHQAQAEKAANKAKDTGLQVTKLVAKARYLAPGHYWAESLEEILSKLEDAKESTFVLKTIQEQMAETLEKDPSNSFAYYCVQIFTEIILDSTNEDVQSQAFCHKNLMSLSFIYGHVTEIMTGEIIAPYSLLGKLLNTIRSKLPKCKTRKDVWTSPRLILSVAFALKKLEDVSNTDIRGDIANYKRDLERKLENKAHESLQVIYENRPSEADLRKNHCKLLNLPLKELAKPLEMTLHPTPTDAEVQAMQAFQMPGKKNVDVERAELLEEIEASFARQSVVVVHGMTGAGKSRLAESYARAQEEFKKVYWIDAAGGENLVKEYKRLALELKVVTKKGSKGARGKEYCVTALKKYFTESPDCLLILDDVNSVKELDYDSPTGKISLIPEKGSKGQVARVLITSQSDLFSKSELVEVTELKSAEATRILAGTISKKVSEEHLSDLAKLLYYHPLLIDLTGSYIEEKAGDERSRAIDEIVLEEIEKLSKSSKHIPEDRDREIIKQVELRWRVNRDKAIARNTHVAEALGVCAYLAPNRIPLGWLEDDLRKSIDILEAYGFCHRDAEGETISMHGLVQKLSRREDTDYKALHMVVKMLNEKLVCSGEQLNIQDIRQNHPEHLLDVGMHLINGNVTTKGAAEILCCMGEVCDSVAHFEESLYFWDRALNTFKALKDDSCDLSVAKCLNKIGSAHYELEQYIEALKSYQEALEMSRRLTNNSDEEIVLDCLRDLGKVYLRRMDYEAALKSYQEALEMSRRLSDNTDDEIVLDCLRDLGKVYLRRMDYEAALKSYQEALEVSRRLSDNTDDEIVLDCLRDLGRVYIALEEYSEALAKYQEALEMSGRLSDNTDNYMVEECLRGLGDVYLELGEHEEALKSYQEALEMSRRLSDNTDDHNDPIVIECLRDLGRVYIALEEYSESLKSYQEALEMSRRQSNNSDDDIVVECLRSLGHVYLKKKDYDKAINSYKEALEIIEDLHPGSIKIETISLLFNIKEVYKEIGDYQEVRKYLEKILKLREQSTSANTRALCNNAQIELENLPETDDTSPPGIRSSEV